jgi:F0F1-type ATP synthase assembly protein I
MKQEDRGAFRGSEQMLGVGIGFLVECGLFAALGWWLDGKFGTNPWLLITGVGLGFSYATWNLLRQFGGEVEAPVSEKDRDE